MSDDHLKITPEDKDYLYNLAIALDKFNTCYNTAYQLMLQVQTLAEEVTEDFNFIIEIKKVFDALLIDLALELKNLERMAVSDFYWDFHQKLLQSHNMQIQAYTIISQVLETGNSFLFKQAEELIVQANTMLDNSALVSQHKKERVELN